MTASFIASDIFFLLLSPCARVAPRGEAWLCQSRYRRPDTSRVRDGSRKKMVWGDCGCDEGRGGGWRSEDWKG